MFGRFSVVVVTCMMLAEPVRSQEVTLRPEPPCDRCVVYFQVEDTLGAAADPVSPGPTAEAGVLASGEVVVSSPPIGAELAVYGPDGRYVRPVGSQGAGPGEFSTAPLLEVVNGNTIVTLDPRAGRVTTFTGAGEYTGSIQLGLRAMTFAVTADGGVVVSGMRADSLDAGILHIVAAGGGVARSFGPAPAGGASPFTVVRHVAVASDGAIWTAVISGGRLEHWSAEGELVQAFRIDDPELQRPAGMRVDFTRERPPGQVSDLAVDDSGRVWVFYVVADAEFEPGPDAGNLAPERIYDTRVLVIDPGPEAVVAAGTFDGLLRPLAPGRGYDLVSLPSGDRRLVTGRIGIVGEDGSP